jgi:hypothetical protein
MLGPFGELSESLNLPLGNIVVLEAFVCSPPNGLL